MVTLPPSLASLFDAERDASIDLSSSRWNDPASGFLVRDAGSGEAFMDALSDVLRVVQLSGAVYLNAEFTAPWCLYGQPDGKVCAAFLPQSDRIVSYHLITGGSCWAKLVDDEHSMV